MRAPIAGDETMRRLIGRLLAVGVDITSLTCATISVVWSGYLAVLSLAGLRRSRHPRPAATPATRFAVVVPAHDEAHGIRETLTAFDRVDYPRDRFDVHVVADNCSDDTAAVVRASGWRVHERADPDDPGKGPALNWMFDRLVEQAVDFDAVAIVDADTTIDVEFLAAMDRALTGGAAVAQGFYSVRDADASPATTFRYAALACRHHLRPLGRSRLGASCGLYGNGMVFRRSVLSTRRWSGHLVEDAELQNEMLLDGIVVTYVPDAVVEAEMPVSNDAARSQNQRWERGRIELAQRYVPRLVSRALRGRRRRVVYLDAAADHLVPPLSVLLAFELAAAAVSAGAVVFRRPRARLALGADLVAILAIAGHVVGGLYSVRAPKQHYRALAGTPRIAAWKVALWIGVIADGDIDWTRTRRNSEGST